MMSKLLQLVFHQAYLNQRFPHMAQSIQALVELGERRARLEEMRRDYCRHFESSGWTGPEAKEEQDRQT